ncbi:MAG TPA: hypothetical protein PLW65_08480 [Pseudomonadota bacterium]|nr:hypothetical protein [Pseudomonadota bacterium]
MTSANSRLLLVGGLGLLAGGSLIVFTITIGAGRLTGPGVLLAGSVGTLGVVAYLLVRTAQALVETGVAAQAREERAATGRRRKELEREYNTLKRAIKELELDYAMGKISEQDYGEIRTRYRERAVRVLRQLDQGESYRAQIERDLQARRQAKGLPKKAPDGQPAAAPATPSATSAEPTAVTAVPAGALAADLSAETPKKNGGAPKPGATGQKDRASASDSLTLPDGYEPSIISEEPTKAAGAFAALALNRPSAPSPALQPGYEASIISEEPTKAATGFVAAAPGKATVEVQPEGLNFSDSATVMRAVAKLTGGNTVSSELTQNEQTQQTAVPGLQVQSSGPLSGPGPGQPGPIACAGCAAINDTDANFCKKCGARLHS